MYVFHSFKSDSFSSVTFAVLLYTRGGGKTRL